MTEENLTRRYLLGQLSAEERQKIEERYFAESNAFEELITTEDDLIDSYARGQLSSSERQQFEQRYFSSPEGRSRVEFARALGDIVRSREVETKNKKQSFWALRQRLFRFGYPSVQWAWVAVCLVLCMAVFFLTFRNRELNRELLDARNSEARLRTQRDEAVGQIASLNQVAKDQSAKPPVRADARDLAFTLVAGIVRGESMEVLVVPRDRPWIRLEMPIDEDAFKGYDAVLYTPEMHELRRGQNLKSRPTANGIKVDWRIPSESLESGDYVLELIGKEDSSVTERLSVYSFHLVRK
jgi:anti-sigma-K factor RskA